jgi:hypothetical protein
MFYSSFFQSGRLEQRRCHRSGGIQADARHGLNTAVHQIHLSDRISINIPDSDVNCVHLSELPINIQYHTNILLLSLKNCKFGRKTLKNQDYASAAEVFYYLGREIF